MEQKVEKKKVLAAVFSSLQGLEKCVQTSTRLSSALPKSSNLVSKAINDQKQILGQMRKTANKLQLELASEEWDNIVRSLQIFYGLRQMVRPEIMSTFQGLANKELKLPNISADAVVH